MAVLPLFCLEDLLRVILFMKFCLIGPVSSLACVLPVTLQSLSDFTGALRCVSCPAVGVVILFGDILKVA